MNPLFIKEYVILIGALVIVAGVWLTWRSSAKASLRQRVLMLLFRAFGLTALACIALNPGVWHSDANDTKKKWAFMVDRSQSMQVKDDQKQSRWDHASAMIDSAVTDWHDCEVYPFSDTVDKGVSSAEELRQTKADGKITDIDKSGLDLLRSQLSTAKCKGIILLSDGRQVVKTAIKEELPLTARAKNVPIYAIPVGGNVVSRDLELKVGKRQYLAFKGQPVRISVELENHNMGNLQTTIKLETLDKKISKTRKVDSAKDSRKTVTFDVNFDRTGYHDFVVQVPAEKGDSNPRNNLCRIGVAIIDKKLNVLYLEGSPFWDSKFLSQLLSMDPNINLTTVYRLASDKYMSISSSGKSDRLKKTGWPESLEALKKFDLIIVGKGIEYFLDDDRIAQLKQYLVEHGGALLLARGKPYQNTYPAFAQVEPVVWGDPIEGNYLWEPTVQGKASGLFGNLLPGRDSPIWRELPTIKKAYRCPKLRTFAEAYAEGHTERAASSFRFPVVISRKYGRGIVLAVNSEGLWHWDFFPGSEKISRFYREFWIQTVHWMIRHSDFVPGLAYSLNLNKNAVYPGETVIATVHSRQKRKDALPYLLEVRKNDKVIQRFSSDTEKGASESRSIIFSLGDPGTYNIDFTYKDGGKTETIHAILFVKPHPQENDNLSVNRQYLKDLAERSGGRILKPQELKELLVKGADEQVQEAGVVNLSWHPYWIKWWVLCLILASFGGECFLRRRNGML